MIVSAIATIALGSMLQNPAKIQNPALGWRTPEFQKQLDELRKMIDPGTDYKPLAMPKLDTELKIVRVQRDISKNKGMKINEVPIEFKYRSKLSPSELVQAVEKPLKEQGWRKLKTDDSGFRFSRENKTGPIVWQEVTISLDMDYFYRTGQPAPTQLIYIEKPRI